MNNSKKKVAILMSTYNGEKFISTQLESIIKQENVEINLYIRDDGSCDKTKEIINEFIIKYPNKIQLLESNNIGFANSFYELIKLNIDADYYAFSDQDDIWEKDKLNNAIININNNLPCLYGSNLKLFDMIEQRNNYLFDKEDISAPNRFKEYFYMQNPYGCTMVWNKKLHEKLKEYPKPTQMTHDTWVNIIANCTGKLYFDLSSYINYRIHGNNACGMTPKSNINKLKKYIKVYFIDKKKLNISFTCKYVMLNFPQKSNKVIKWLSEYDYSFNNYIKSIYNVLIKASIPEKKKILLLMLFKKL